jgi:amino acid permease
MMEWIATYAKTWLQFMFPVYVLVLLLIIALLNKWKKIFNDKSSDEIPHPWYVMATFFILAYGKIVRTIIVAKSILHHPGVSQR